MKNILTIFLYLIFSNFCTQAQDNPREVTPAIEKKIKQEIETAVLKLKEELKTAKASALSIEFTIDTFQIEQFMGKYISYDYTTAGMSSSAYTAAHQYDSLLNKYYKKLLNVLSAEDKKFLIQAQKSWISYRDNETKLTDIIGKDQYSGGGTIQQLTESSSYLDLIRNRTIDLFHHLQRAMQEY